MTIFGFFGGFVSALFDIVETKKTCNADDSDSLYKPIISPDFCSVLCKAIIGVAGAYGVIFLGVWVGKITMEGSVSNQVFLSTLCAVAGTVSYRLLPKIGIELENQLIRKEIAEAEKKVEITSKKTVDFTTAMTAAETALSRNIIHDMPHAITMLESIKGDHTTHRSLHIYLGRLHRKLHDYDKAITILRDLIKNIEVEKKKKIRMSPSHWDVDCAAAYYNIACYHAVKEAELTEPEHEKTRLKNEALEAITTAIELDPKNIEMAKEDDDLVTLRENPKFKSLIGA